MTPKRPPTEAAFACLDFAFSRSVYRERCSTAE
jgi:hypothetical protein